MSDVARAGPQVVFVHLQKTAGATLRSLFFSQYRPESLLKLEGERRTSDALLAAYWASAEEQRRVQAVVGHFAGRDWDFGPEARYVTVLRDPVERVVSMYYHLQKHGSEHGKGLSLSEFVTEDDTRGTVHNFQTRVLGQVGGISPPHLTPATLALAKRNLEQRFVVVGLTERFDESVLLMRRALSWSRMPFYEATNVGDRPALADLPEGLVAAIEERNTLDTELHTWAAARLDKAVEAAGAAFRAEVTYFRLLNSGRGRRWRAGAAKTRRRARAVPRRARRVARKGLQVFSR